MDEKIPETVVGQCSPAQEILDFIIENYRFIRLEKLSPKKFLKSIR